MSKRMWIIILGLFAGLIAADQISKLWAAELPLYQIYDYGPLRIVHVQNHGAIGGALKQLPRILKVVSLSTLGSFLLFLFLTLQYLLPIKSTTLRVGITFLFGGFLGNVIDRVAYGHVVDFISASFMRLPAWNVADMFQWVGVALSALPFYRISEVFWPENERRGKRWINAKFQFRYATVLIASCCGFAVVAWAFAFTFIRESLVEYSGKDSEFINQFLTSFSILFAIVLLSFSLFLLVISLFLSHRIVGPVHAVQRYVRDLLRGKDYRFTLRQGDEFMELETFAAEMRVRIQETSVDEPRQIVTLKKSGS